MAHQSTFGLKPAESQPGLDAFHPIVARWFRRRVGDPTDVQKKTWPQIAQGRHVLVTAPTGSGKTLTAFLWSLNCFAAGTLAPGATRVLYVSPLKALNNDIRQNLLVPLEALEAAGGFPSIRALTRSGDTSTSTFTGLRVSGSE